MTNLSGQTIGIVGLGLMGRPMGRNLMAAGARLVVHNRSPGPVGEMAADGAVPADSPRAVAEAAETVIIMVADTAAVEAVISGADGVVAGVRPGSLVIDMGTTAFTATQEFARRVADAGGDYVDAPVSGGTVGAEAGALTIMAGGTEAAFQRAGPVFDVLGGRVTHVGGTGTGQVAKAANQVIVGLTIGAVAEALTLGVKAGVDLAVLADVIANSSGGSKRLTEKFPRYLFQGNFEPGFATALAAKDVRLATDLGREYGIPMELSNLVDQLHVEALNRGWGHEDSDAVARIQEEKSGVQLRLKGV